MKTLTSIFITTLILVFIGCSSVDVTTDHDPEIDFSKYKTYLWYGGEMPADDKLNANPLVKKRVASSVENVLESKGFTKGADGQADMVVIIHAGSKERMQVTDFGYGGYGYGGYGYGRYGGGWGGYGGGTSVHYYEETTLIIDLIDVELEELVWRGSGTGTVKDYSDQQEMQEAIDYVVATIMYDFPPLQEK
ncbi:MAG: DUF4136 domain-containing protein [Ignavibacteriae bacterium]|nr:MAG: DUF4136 domain-containing protein [Ignavibacteriota bacterium]